MLHVHWDPIQVYNEAVLWYSIHVYMPSVTLVTSLLHLYYFLCDNGCLFLMICSLFIRGLFLQPIRGKYKWTYSVTFHTMDHCSSHQDLIYGFIVVLIPGWQICLVSAGLEIVRWAGYGNYQYPCLLSLAVTIKMIMGCSCCLRFNSSILFAWQR